MGDEVAAESFAKYHDERAGFGGVGREFHERAASFLRTQAAEIATLSQRVEACDAALHECARYHIDPREDSP